MLSAFLESEFDLACRNRSQEHRRHLAAAGITFQAMLRAGDLGVERINASGRLYMPSPTGFPAMSGVRDSRKSQAKNTLARAPGPGELARARELRRRGPRLRLVEVQRPQPSHIKRH